MIRSWGGSLARASRALALAAGVAAAAPAAPAADAPVRLTLAEAVHTAAAESPEARIGTFKSQQASRRAFQSLAALLPSLAGSASTSNRTFNLRAQGFPLPASLPDVIGPIDNVDARVRVTQTVLDLPSWLQWRAAALGSAAGRADRDASAESAAQTGALAWLRAARGAARVDARRQDLALALELLHLAREQHAAGASPAIDTTRASTQVVASRSALLVAENEVDRARLDLARAVGLDPARPPLPADALSDTSAATDAPTDATAALAMARMRRPELSAQVARLQRSRTEMRATSLERLPRLDAAADWGLSGQHTEDWKDTRSYSLGLTLPLVDGGRREARIAEQSARVGEEAERDRDLRDQVLAEVRAALLDLASNREQRLVAAERLRLAEEEVAQASERFTSGVAGNIELIDAQVSLLRARDAEIDARFGLASARVALARAAGMARQLR